MKSISFFLTCFILQLSLQFNAQFGAPMPMMPITVGYRPTQITINGEVKPFGAKELNIRYDYSSVTIGPENESENDYLDKKAAKLDESRPGKGDSFRQDWFIARTEKYEPIFAKMFNRVGARIGISGTNYATQSPVTVLVKTLNIDPGFYAFAVKKPTYLTVQIIVLDIYNKELFAYILKDVPENNITDCYARAAGIFMKKLSRKLREIEKQKKTS